MEVSNVETNKEPIVEKEVTPGVVVETTGAEVTPEVVTSTETKPEETGDFNDFLSVKGEAHLEEEKKVEGDKKEDKKVAAPELDTKKEEKVEVTPVVKVEGKADATKPAARDYTGLPDNVVAILKKSHNSVFDLVKPLYLEAEQAKKELVEKNKQLEEKSKGSIPDNYYEHPEAYILSPDFQVVAKDVNDSSAVFNHWKQQLQAVRQGATEYTTLAKDAKGNIVYGEKKPADGTAETTLLEFFNFAQNQLVRNQGKLESLKDTYSAKNTEASSQLKTLEDNWFPIFKDGKHPLMPMVQDTIKQLPIAYQKNPLAIPLAKALTTTLRLGNILQEIKKTGKLPEGLGGKVEDKKAAAAEDTKKAGPTKTSSSAAVKPNKAEDEVTMDDFDAIKNS